MLDHHFVRWILERRIILSSIRAVVAAKMMRQLQRLLLLLLRLRLRLQRYEIARSQRAESGVVGGGGGVTSAVATRIAAAAVVVGGAAAAGIGAIVDGRRRQ